MFSVYFIKFKTKILFNTEGLGKLKSMTLPQPVAS